MTHYKDIKASDLFVKALENEGVEYIFGVPGEENLDFIDSLRSSSIRLVLTRHEQAAGFMAATYGRLTGKPGVCLATLGPGATNLVTAAAYSQLGAMPMLMITGQKPIRKSKQGRFQIVDVVGMMQPITKYSQQIVDAKRIPSLVREAFRLAAEERPGAVHLELPEDIAAEQAESADGVIALDNGMYKIWFARNYRCGQHNSVLLDNALATMGAGLPGLIPAYTCQHADPAIRKHPDFQG